MVTTLYEAQYTAYHFLQAFPKFLTFDDLSKRLMYSLSDDSFRPRKGRSRVCFNQTYRWLTTVLNPPIHLFVLNPQVIGFQIIIFSWFFDCLIRNMSPNDSYLSNWLFIGLIRDISLRSHCHTYVLCASRDGKYDSHRYVMLWERWFC